MDIPDLVRVQALVIHEGCRKAPRMRCTLVPQPAQHVIASAQTDLFFARTAASCFHGTNADKE